MTVELKTSHIEKESPVKRGIMRNYGPGIVVALTWLGAGDLVSASVAGASYGYGLMWALALSLLIRFAIVNIMARYQLCNSEGISILQGFSRLHKSLPYFLGLYALIMGHLYNASVIIGTGEVLAWIFNFGPPFMWSVFTGIVSLFIIRKNIFNTIENVMKVLLAVMTISIVGLAIWSTPSVGNLVKGTIGFDIPANVGAYGALLLVLSLIGTVAGSINNFSYMYFIKDKGWSNPLDKRLQRNDLLFGIIMTILITLSIWIVGAEILKPNGIQVIGLNDLSNILSIHFGYFGSFLFYLGVFGALYSSYIGNANGLPKLAIDSLQIIKHERKEKFGEKLDNDPLFKWFSLFILITPILWAIPGMPGFVTVTLYVSALSVIGIPVISIGILILSNKKELGKYRNNWFENLILVVTTILAFWGTMKLIMGFFS
ncbi:Nramp family divalent metal transporter [Fictibacillus sp. FJAT-27399]|uniref:Nramp family divalent metal transporter n=1 Tax=Fictibacillus sp. FJAT-27399 TaxID=1729689 RepID=UPI0007816B5E|nr:Nramp family divalent metal transporter [Fictibacillus sp. FJAT-27399]